MVFDILDKELSEIAFQKVKEEVKFDIMHHKGN